MVQDDLALALTLAGRADTLTRARFGALDLRVDTKPDLTPVTDADRAVESDLREVLGRDRPGDRVLGEEFGGTTTLSGRQWIIDPIDGTKNFVRGVPVWATLIALLEDGVPSVGVVSAPALQRRWWAARDQGAFASVDGDPPRRLSVSSVAELSSASLSFSSLSGWADLGLRERFIELTDAVCRVRDGDAVFSPRLAGFVLDAFAGEIPAAQVDPELDLLTPREREVLQHIARGYMYKEIAIQLGISAKTVEAHVSAVLRKLQLSSRHELTRWAVHRRLVDE